jgi:hypothetical protein
LFLDEDVQGDLADLLRLAGYDVLLLLRQVAPADA